MERRGEKILRVVVVPKSFCKWIVVDFQLCNLWGKQCIHLSTKKDARQSLKHHLSFSNES